MKKDYSNLGIGRTAARLFKVLSGGKKVVFPPKNVICKKFVFGRTVFRFYSASLEKKFKQGGTIVDKFKRGFPVRGQRTRSNALTAKYKLWRNFR